MKGKFLEKRIWMISLVLLMTVSSVMTALGAGSGRMELLLKNRNITFDIYKVGEYEESGGEYRASLTEDFEDSGVDLNDLWTDAAKTRQESQALRQYVGRYHPSAYRSGVAAEKNQDSGITYAGKVVVEDLEDGVYLFVKSGGNRRVTVSPFLVTMPYPDESTGTWSYDVKAFPKSEEDSGRGDGGDDGGGDGGDGGGGNPPNEIIVIEEEGPPLTNLEIPDEPVPLTGIPKLGDLGIAGYLAAALAAGIAGSAALWRGRKYREDEE